MKKIKQIYIKIYKIKVNFFYYGILETNFTFVKFLSGRGIKYTHDSPQRSKRQLKWTHKWEATFLVSE